VISTSLIDAKFVPLQLGKAFAALTWLAAKIFFTYTSIKSTISFILKAEPEF
jgi:hypothetical protein